MLFFQCMLLSTNLNFLTLTSGFAWMMKAIRLSELLKNANLSTQCHIPEDLNRQQQCCESL